MHILINDIKVKRILYDKSLIQKKIGLEYSKILVRRLNEISSFLNFEDFLKFGYGKPHKLEGSLSKYYAVNISHNYRLILEKISKIDINIKGVLDYHGGKKEWIIP